jgi:nitroimidazol reductase NimA-like FMN-containing flavoprotein (pyridoxamine 5'-phosphate oxidase superfamily)
MAATKPSPRMTPQEIWDYVIEGHTGIMTTLRRDGMPIALPLWYACLDRTIYLQTRGKKLQRLRHDPRASFLVESGERWADLKAVHLTGTAELVDLEGDLGQRFRAEIDRKYRAFRSADVMPKQTADYYAKAITGVVRFTPDERVLNWDNAKLTGG